jgi:oligoribonuclease NrnB/cAMP/cGMP phosphodiesterase (DHH superfamily)
MDYEPDLCLYHANCDDGFTAAWAIWKRWPDCEFRAVQYGNPIPEDVAGKQILIVDFSWPADQLERMAETAQNVLVLDHHKTAQAALANLHQIVRPTYENVMRFFARMSGGPRSRILVEFDMDRSGARMAWQFAHPGMAVPLLVNLVEDRDLWRFNFPETKPIRMLLQSVPHDFGMWSSIARAIALDLEASVETGTAIQRFYDARVEEMAAAATVQAFEGFAGVPVVHVPYAFVSDVCHRLLAMHPEAPFAAACVIAHGGTTYSLRSADDRADVSEIAKARGGGGHRNAAGFRADD